MKPGQIGWIDLTLGDAPRLRDFYRDVVGWQVEELSMGDYSDYVMKSDGEPVAGICHARGDNADQPPGWTLYVVVEDLDRSLRICQEQGGRIRVQIRTMAEGRFAVIEDPAGSTCALFEAA